MRRHAQADARLAAGDDVVHVTRARGTISVSGPGQNACGERARLRRTASAQRCAAARSATWTISGWSAGRRFASKIRADRGGVAGIGAEPVDGFGRERDELAVGAASARRA